MPSIRINPYLNFNGTAEQAIKLYERALGATYEGIMRWSDAPGMDTTEETRNRVMHATLTIGNSVIMISDTMPGEPVGADGNVEVCVNFDDVKEATARFDALAAGGQVRTPLQDVFWGATYGALTDAFGVRWMFNCQKEPK